MEGTPIEALSLDGLTQPAELLRFARLRAGLTQAELAARAGVRQSMVAAYERGRRQPTLPTLTRLVGASGARMRLAAEVVPAPSLVTAAVKTQGSSGSATGRRVHRGVRRGAMPLASVADRVAERLAEGDEPGAWRWLLQFADDFRLSSCAGRARLVAQRPHLLPDNRYDAAIAALAEHLCAQARMPIPKWTGEEGRFAEPWWFPAGLPALRAGALRDSPISFKRHGVFVGARAFDRV